MTDAWLADHGSARGLRKVFPAGQRVSVQGWRHGFYGDFMGSCSDYMYIYILYDFTVISWDVRVISWVEWRGNDHDFINQNWDVARNTIHKSSMAIQNTLDIPMFKWKRSSNSTSNCPANHGLLPSSAPEGGTPRAVQLWNSQNVGGCLDIQGAFKKSWDLITLISHYINYLLRIPIPQISNMSNHFELTSRHIKFTSLHIRLSYPCWIVKSQCITVSPFIKQMYQIIKRYSICTNYGIFQ